MTELDGALDKRVLEELRDSVGGDHEFVAELVDDFLTDAPGQLETLRAALSSHDSDLARRAAHTLKGTSRTFGAEELASLCQEAEAAAADEIDADEVAILSAAGVGLGDVEFASGLLLVDRHQPAAAIIRSTNEAGSGTAALTIPPPAPEVLLNRVFQYV